MLSILKFFRFLWFLRFSSYLRFLKFFKFLRFLRLSRSFRYLKFLRFPIFYSRFSIYKSVFSKLFFLISSFSIHEPPFSILECRSRFLIPESRLSNLNELSSIFDFLDFRISILKFRFFILGSGFIVLESSILDLPCSNLDSVISNHDSRSAGYSRIYIFNYPFLNNSILNLDLKFPSLDSWRSIPDFPFSNLNLRTIMKSRKSPYCWEYYFLRFFLEIRDWFCIQLVHKHKLYTSNILDKSLLDLLVYIT